MKVERISRVPAFVPVTLTLETKEEALLITKLLGATSQVTSDIYGCGDVYGAWKKLKDAVGESYYHSFVSLRVSKAQ